MAGIDAKAKKPHHFQPLAKPFTFAGVWDVWKGDGKEPTTSFSIVTTSPAPSTAQYRDRMPVVLEKSQFEDWMRGPPELAAEMMEPYGGEIEIWEVGKMLATFVLHRCSVTHTSLTRHQFASPHRAIAHYSQKR